MSVTEVALKTGIEATASDDYRIVYTTVYQVRTDSSSDGPLTVMNAPGLPQIWQTYNVLGEIDVNAYAKKMTARQDSQAAKRWDVTIEWEPLRPGRTPDHADRDPFNRSIKYWIEHVNYTEIMEKDRDDEPIVNSANQPFDEPLTEERARMVLVAEKPFATLQQIVNLNLSHAMSVNSDTFYGATAGRCLCRPIQCSQLMTENDVSFYLGTFRVEIHEDDWARKIVDRGYLRVDGGVHKNAVDSDGNFTAEPLLLDGSGEPLGYGVVGTPLEFDTFKEAAFSGLGI